MSRVEIPYTVTKTNGDAVVGAAVQVNIRGGGPATVFAGETGATTLANPLATTTEGRIDAWLDTGSYTLIVSGAGITTFTQPIEMIRGDAVDHIAPTSVGSSQIVDGSVTTAKFAAQQAWQTLALGAGWSPGNLSYYKDSLGIVRVRAEVFTTGAVAASATIATLPAGYRPGVTTYGTLNLFDSPGQAVAAYPLAVTAAGVISCPTAVGASATMFFTLHFRGEN